MALPSTGVWEIRQGGSATNGGLFDPNVAIPGTDYTLQDNPQITYGDLVIGATTTQLTSTGHPFSSLHPGNTIRITGGTGFTTGWYNVRSVSGSTATMDRSVGTAASSSGAGNLGGGLDHISSVLVSGALAAGNIVFINYSATPYSFGAGVVFSANLGTFVFQGYDTTRQLDNTDANRPIFRPTVNSITMWQMSNNTVHIAGIVFDNPNGKTAVAGLTGSGLNRISRCKFNGLTGSPLVTSSTTCRAIANEVTSCNSSADLISLGGGVAIGNWVVGNPGAGAGIRIGGAGAYFGDNIVANNGGVGLVHTNQAVFDHCTAYGNTAEGFHLSSEGEARWCISYANGTYGYTQSSASVITGRLFYCAAGANGTLGTNGFRSDLLEGLVTLTADPFTDAAGLDFSLNYTAGGGGAVRGPTVAFPAGTTTSYPDLGAAQHSDLNVPQGPVGRVVNSQNIGTY